MNVVKYLEKLIIANSNSKNSEIADEIFNNNVNFPYKRSTIIIMLQTIKRGEGENISGRNINNAVSFVIDPDDDETEISITSGTSSNVGTYIFKEPVNIADIEAEEAEEENIKSMTEESFYVYEDGIYNIGEDLKLKGELINKLFIDYPSKGLNLSRIALINKYNLKQYGDNGPSVLRTIQHTLGLYKDSNIVPPHIYQELSSKEIDAYIDSQLDLVITNPEFIEKKYSNRVLAQYRRAINEQTLNTSKLNDKLEELTNVFKTIKKNIILTTSPNSKNGNVVVTIADMHTGAAIKNVQRTHDFDHKIIKSRLHDISTDLNDSGYNGVYIAVMGDVFQGTPYNHIGAGDNMEFQYAKQFKVGYELLIEFIENVNNVKGIYAIGGNHDRASADNRMDKKASQLDILMFTLSKIIKDIPIEFNHDTISFEVDDICYILQHGHFNYHKKNAADIILDHGNPKLFNMILRAHLHSLQVLSNDDRRNYRRVVVPSIYTGENYSSEGGWSNNAGYTKFSKSQFDISDCLLSPKMVIEPLA